MLTGSCRLGPIGKYQYETLKVARKAFNTSKRSGAQYVAMITEIESLYCGAHWLESYCKEWLRYPCLSYLIKTSWLSVHDIICWVICIFKNLNI